MKKITAALLFTCVALACKYSADTSPAQLQENLKKTMTDFLERNYATRHDTAKVKYDVVEVVYYDAPEAFNCQFKVHIVKANRDTTEFMKANISKDFKRVF